MNIGYVRVSTVEQNEERQIEALKKYNIDKWFSEKISAKDTNRPKLKQMLDFAREGDKVFIHDFSRLARSTKDLLAIVEVLSKKNIELNSIKENIDTATPTGKLMLTMVGAISEFERANLLERIREGISIAKRNGKYKGRKKIVINDIEKHYKRYFERQVNKTQLAIELSISRPTLDRLFAEYEKKK